MIIITAMAMITIVVIIPIIKVMVIIYELLIADVSCYLGWSVEILVTNVIETMK